MNHTVSYAEGRPFPIRTQNVYTEGTDLILDANIVMKKCELLDLEPGTPDETTYMLICGPDGVVKRQTNEILNIYNRIKNIENTLFQIKSIIDTTLN